VEIGNKIRVLREVRGFSQEYMADQVGISQAAYSKIERNETEVTLTRLDQISKVLEVSLIDLLSFDNKFVFNNCHNCQGNLYGNLITNEGLSAIERKFYEDKIALQNELLELYRKNTKES